MFNFNDTQAHHVLYASFRSTPFIVLDHHWLEVDELNISLSVVFSLVQATVSRYLYAILE